MTTQTAPAARKFQPIFTATVTPGSVSTRNGKNGKYVVSQKSQFTTAKNDQPREITLMAFGKGFEAIQGKLRKGRAIDLAVQFDGGSLKVIGLPREEAPAAAEG
ncbi:hypothetical protein [Erythrobacter aureus]|uniref:Uncharacterized protein n=1 Tax=Erythrobacter aureus TaxID=2182384 RepID=A0A345YIR6_9SPHN|nr:hypothetical protein [Erythrobacter aureus]AXK43818.1 hypothetical protein DVR09_15290 [Erythrobacter aureus]